MLKLNRSTVENLPVYPERILQFGEGNFLRAFADWMVTKMNRNAGFNSGVVVVQPIERGMVDMINAQDGLYHVYLKGIKDGKPVKEFTLVDCITRGLNPYTQLIEYKEVIENHFKIKKNDILITCRKWIDESIKIKSNMIEIYNLLEETLNNL